MSKARFICVLLALLVVTGLIALRIAKTSTAAVQYQDAQTSSGEPVELQLLNPTQVPTTPEEASSSVPENSQVAVKASDQLRDTVERWKEKTLEAGKWVHFVYSSKSEVENGVVLPNGEPLAKSQIRERWFLLDQEGFVVQGVFTTKSEDGGILQQSAYNEGVEVNFTTGERATDLPPYPFKPDLSYSLDMLAMEAQDGITLTSQETAFRGIASRQFSVKETYATPVKLSNSPLPVASIVNTVFFDLETDALIHGSKVFILENGQEIVFEENDILALEITDVPPDDIRAILEGIK